MRRSASALLVMAVSIAFGVVLSPSPAGAACAPATIEVQPATGEPGSSVTLIGSNFGTDCIDVGPNPGLGAPAMNISLAFLQGSLRVELGTVDADQNYAFSFPATVPDPSVPGDAVFEAGVAGPTPTTAAFVVVAAGAAPAAPAAPVDVAPSFTG